MEIFWKNDNWEAQDRHFQQLQQSPFKRQFPSVSLTPGVTMIRGPRQIGKSTWLKVLLKQSLEGGISSFYYSCEDLKDFKDLGALIDSQPDIECFFLDEISYVDEWWRAIKKETDSHINRKFVLTGSNSYDLKRGVDLMPGRWSQAGELSLLPMDFFEWQKMREQAGWQSLKKIEALKAYMQTGGFPAALAEAGPELQVPTRALQTYRRWIEGDVLKLGRQSQFMRELMGVIAKNLGASMSLQTLAQKTQLMSFHTAQDYLTVLEHAFALRTLYFYNPETDTFQFKKQKKFYFTDPLIYQVALDWTGLGPQPNAEAALAETIAAEFLMRREKRMGYFADRNGEIDFVTSTQRAIEVKWAPTPGNLSKTFKNLAWPNKQVWTQETFFSFDGV